MAKPLEIPDSDIRLEEKKKPTECLPVTLSKKEGIPSVPGFANCQETENRQLSQLLFQLPNPLLQELPLRFLLG